MQYTSAFYDFTYKPLKNQKCKWLNPINYCLYCILWLKGASDKYFKYNPAISLCAVTLIHSDWCPVPIFVHLGILFPFILLLSTVLGFSFIHHCTQVILIPSAFPIVAETMCFNIFPIVLLPGFFRIYEFIFFLFLNWTQIFIQCCHLLCMNHLNTVDRSYILPYFFQADR